jgi:hypothetical protein
MLHPCRVVDNEKPVDDSSRSLLTQCQGEFLALVYELAENNA